MNPKTKGDGRSTALSAETVEQLKTWERLGRVELLAPLRLESANDEQRSVDVLFFSGIDVERFSWLEGPYMLRFDPKGADLTELNKRAPILDNHWCLSVGDQYGVVDKAWQEKSNYLATIRLQRSTELTGPRREADCLWQDIKDGIVSKFSMGVQILAMEDKRDKDGKLTLRTATKWQPFEISIAPLAADTNTATLAREFGWTPNLSLAAHRDRQIDILRLR